MLMEILQGSGISRGGSTETAQYSQSIHFTLKKKITESACWFSVSCNSWLAQIFTSYQLCKFRLNLKSA